MPRGREIKAVPRAKYRVPTRAGNIPPAVIPSLGYPKMNLKLRTGMLWYIRSANMKRRGRTVRKVMIANKVNITR